MRQGKDGEAINRYSAAAQRAPRWGALHVKWGLALQRAGQRTAARNQLAAAGDMARSAADRRRANAADVS